MEPSRDAPPRRRTCVLRQAIRDVDQSESYEELKRLLQDRLSCLQRLDSDNEEQVRATRGWRGGGVRGGGARVVRLLVEAVGAVLPRHPRPGRTADAHAGARRAVPDGAPPQTTHEVYQDHMLRACKAPDEVGQFFTALSQHNVSLERVRAACSRTSGLLAVNRAP